MIPVYTWPEEAAQSRIKARTFEEAGLWASVAAIVEAVRLEGDPALLRYTQEFDGCFLEKAGLKVSAQELEAAYSQVDPGFLEALRLAKERILSFHRLQKQKDWFDQDSTGSLVGQVFRPLARVGVYVPGGTANYPSSVLMTCLPAVVAGVPEIVMVTPPGRDGLLPPATLVAAREAGVTEIYRIGGAQAIAALAYGTATIKPVDKIVGPGNIYVTLAKKMVFGQVGIDMLAGPSEILLVGDGSVSPAYAAADLLSQAEHDKRARAVLLTNNEAWAREVLHCLSEQLSQLPRREIAEESLKNNGAVIITASVAEAIQIANEMAAEHLELLVDEPWTYLAQVKHAGAIFLGPYSPEALGDYLAGPNHVLPTGGTARYASPLNVDDFCKRSSIINYSRHGLEQASGAIRHLTRLEGLAAHGASVEVRMKEEGE